jgi:hypothetical protein
MTTAEAKKIIAKTKQVAIQSTELVGYELQTLDLLPSIDADMIFLARAIQDCDGSYGSPCRHLIATDGTHLTLWTLPNQ